MGDDLTVYQRIRSIKSVESEKGSRFSGNSGYPGFIVSGSRKPALGCLFLAPLVCMLDTFKPTDTVIQTTG
jgi:hypothetical protein